MLAVAFFICSYALCILVGWLILMILGVDFMEALSVTISSMGNAGLALGQFGPAYSWSALPEAGKWVCSFLMLLGRLEMFAVLLLFYPAFWRKR